MPAIKRNFRRHGHLSPRSSLSLRRLAFHFGWALVLFLSSIASSCKSEQSGKASASAPAAAFADTMGEFPDKPDEAHYRKLLLRATESSDPMLRTVLEYEQFSKKCRPVDDPSVNIAELNRRMAGRSSGDFQIVEEVMVRHEDPWRRWTVAKFLGEYSGKQSIPKLQTLLNDKEPFVRSTAADAIENINARSPAVP